MVVTDWVLLCSFGYQGGGSIFNGKGKPITKGYGTLWQDYLEAEERESVLCEHCTEYHINPSECWQQEAGELCPLCREYTIGGE